MAQAPLHLRLEDSERLLPNSFASLAARVRYSRGKSELVGSGRLFPVPLSLAQAEQLLEDYKRLRDTLGTVRKELCDALGKPFEREHNNLYQYRKSKPYKAKKVKVAKKPKIKPEWQQVLDRINK